jgi:hypothetical protein
VPKADPELPGSVRPVPGDESGRNAPEPLVTPGPDVDSIDPAPVVFRVDELNDGFTARAEVEKLCIGSKSAPASVPGLGESFRDSGANVDGEDLSDLVSLHVAAVQNVGVVRRPMLPVKTDLAIVDELDRVGDGSVLYE